MAAAPTLILDQTPDGAADEENRTGTDGANVDDVDLDLDAEGYARRAWVSAPRDNTFMIFPGNRLHGVLPDCAHAQWTSREPPYPGKFF